MVKTKGIPLMLQTPEKNLWASCDIDSFKNPYNKREILTAAKSGSLTLLEKSVVAGSIFPEGVKLQLPLVDYDLTRHYVAQINGKVLTSTELESMDKVNIMLPPVAIAEEDWQEHYALTGYLPCEERANSRHNIIEGIVMEAIRGGLCIPSSELVFTLSLDQKLTKDYSSRDEFFRALNTCETKHRINHQGHLSTIRDKNIGLYSPDNPLEEPQDEMTCFILIPRATFYFKQ